MKNNAGVLKTVPTGLSWTGFFFTYITMWVRGMVGPGFLWLFILSWIQGIWIFTVLSAGVMEAFAGGDGSVTGGLSTFFSLVVFGFSFLFLFKLNRWSARYWLNRGFVPQGQGWSVWGPKYGVEVTEEMKAADADLAPQKKVTGKDIVGFIVVGILFLSLLSGGGGGGATSESTSYGEDDQDAGTVSEPAQRQSAPAKSAYGLNEPVKVGHMEWTITNVRTGTRFSADFSEVSVGSDETILVWVYGKVTNRSSEEDVSLGNLYLVDSSGTKYGESDEGAMVADPLALDSFNPNVPKSFSTIFEVPRSAKGLSFLATDFGMWSEKTAKVNLGLDNQ